MHTINPNPNQSPNSNKMEFVESPRNIEGFERNIDFQVRLETTSDRATNVLGKLTVNDETYTNNAKYPCNSMNDFFQDIDHTNSPVLFSNNFKDGVNFSDNFNDGVNFSDNFRDGVPSVHFHNIKPTPMQERKGYDEL
jgi:hypothetical protein